MTSLVAFKYRAVDENLIDSVRESYMYFSSPDQLNDPFDCRVDIHSALNAAGDRSEGQTAEIIAAILTAKPLFDQIQADMETFGVFSLSSTVTNSVMWSQYADRHRGVCLTYDIPDDFINDPVNKIIGRAPVSYGDEPVTDWLLENAHTVDFDDPRDFAIELMKKVLTVKAADWGYEREYRLIRVESGPLAIPGEFLTQVCFGLETTDDDIGLVANALSAAKVDVSKVKSVRTESNFGLNAIEI